MSRELDARHLAAILVGRPIRTPAQDRPNRVAAKEGTGDPAAACAEIARTAGAD